MTVNKGDNETQGDGEREMAEPDERKQESEMEATEKKSAKLVIFLSITNLCKKGKKTFATPECSAKTKLILSFPPLT